MTQDFSCPSPNTNFQLNYALYQLLNYALYEVEQLLLEEARELLNHNSSSGRLIYAFVRRNLHVFHLNDYFSEAAILNEALIRAVEATRKGTIIRELPAWLRSASYNIIREKSRFRQKFVSLESQPSLLEQVELEPEDIEDDLRYIQAAFGMLEPKDRRLLTLKVVEGRSWQEIYQILKEEGQRDCSIATLRKQKERALVRLRKQFHALHPPEF
jgi:RNA polymerase sigma factor (sigma-70 family)